MTVLVDSKVFKQMISYKPLTNNQSESKKMKFTLLDDIKDFFSDKWQRLKNGTRSAIDMMAFLSAERGFVYASQSYLGERYDVSDRTIRRVMSDLERVGLIYTVYRRHSKGNSKGKPIYLFTQHPYFSYWVELLGLDDQNRVREETAEYIDGPTDEEANLVPTKYIPILKQESNIIISNNKIVQYLSNRINDAIKDGSTIKYMSSYVDRMVRSLETQALYAENRRQAAIIKKREEESRKLLSPIKNVPFYNWLES